ncbi:hypothetical protein [Micromonospora sp. NPDC049282]|uniref:hypothetical protein n=1 Tax=Micromonospora sp. NPDC049282 TaxID=3364269 RepID=UPI00371421A7
MASLLDRIPTIEFEPEAGGVGTAATPMAGRPGGATAERPAPRTGIERRSFLRTLIVGGGALAVTMFTWVGERVPAFAAKGDRITLHPTACMGIDVSGDTPCWGRTYISSTYCGTDGRHRNDTVNMGTYDRLYSWEPACGGYAGWYWINSSDVQTRCWDGRYYTMDHATGQKNGPYTTCCKKLV